MSLRHFLGVCAVGGSLLLASCDSVRQVTSTLGDLQQVQGEIRKSLNNEQLLVNLMNGRTLTLSLVNSRLKDLPGDQKKAKALEIAQLAYQTYPSRASLETVRVIFVVNRTYAFILHFTDGTDAYNFTPADLSPAPRSAP